jgi:putative endopeptidase
MLALVAPAALGEGAADGAAEGVPERIFELERALAAHHWDAVASRDDSATYNPTTWSELAARAAGFEWEEFASGLGGRRESLERLVVRQPSFVDQMAASWAEAPLEELKLWTVWRVVQARAGLLSEAIVRQNFEFTGKVLSGAQELRERWKRGISLVEGVLGEAVGRWYAARHFPPEHKARVGVIVDNLLGAYRHSIERLDWMGDETKARALDKLALFTPKIGYPDRWRDFSALRVDPADLVGNVRAAHAFETDRELAKAAGPVDRGEWFMTPQTVNAYYNPGMNEIVFPAAILQPPFFDAAADDAANYGGIGAVIGHEIGHGFDDQGSKYDGEGRMVDWWTESDRAEFERRTKALIAQFDAYTPRQLAGQEDAPHVNGALTIGENIGDLGGLAIAWRAYLLALGADPDHLEEGAAARLIASAPVIDSLGAAERFFAGWAQSWRTEVRDAEMIRRLTTDPHSPAEFRCNGVVRNLAAFHAAYGVRAGDALYLAPEDRVTIW